LDKLPEKLPAYYRKEGVVHGLRSLAKRHTDNNNNNSAVTSSTTTTTPQKDFSKAAQAAKTLLQQRFANDEKSSRLSPLSKAARALRQAKPSLADAALLDGLLSAICGGVSPFEFAEAGVVEALLAFVSPTNRSSSVVAKRLHELMHALSRLDGAATTLVGHLQHNVTRHVSFL
jgi:hypothetical protein